MMSGADLPLLWQTAGMWIGLAISLALFSLIAGENLFSRLAQYVLVGTGMGYAAVVAWQEVLRPRLFVPLLTGQADDWTLWAALLLGSLLWMAGVERVAVRQEPSSLAPPQRTRLILRGLGVLPAALLLGAALGVGLAGVWQGTLLPQIGQAIGPDLGTNPSPDTLFSAGLVLLLTTGALLAVVVDGDRRLALPAGVRAVINLWIWLGRRGIWVAAGVIFARLLVARFSLLIGWFYNIFIVLEETGLWRWADSIWQQFFG
jgi:hypothetical protein